MKKRVVLLCLVLLALSLLLVSCTLTATTTTITEVPFGDTTIPIETSMPDLSAETFSAVLFFISYFAIGFLFPIAVGIVCLFLSKKNKRFLWVIYLCAAYVLLALLILLLIVL